MFKDYVSDQENSMQRQRFLNGTLAMQAAEITTILYWYSLYEVIFNRFKSHNKITCLKPKL